MVVRQRKAHSLIYQQIETEGAVGRFYWSNNFANIHKPFLKKGKEECLYWRNFAGTYIYMRIGAISQAYIEPLRWKERINAICLP
jgi:hypothetical protein